MWYKLIFRCDSEFDPKTLGTTVTVRFASFSVSFRTLPFTSTYRIWDTQILKYVLLCHQKQKTVCRQRDLTSLPQESYQT